MVWQLSRVSVVGALVVATVCLIVGSSPAGAASSQQGQPAVIINGQGGVNANGLDGLKIVLNGADVSGQSPEDGSDQIYFANTYQYCCGGGSPMLNIGGTLYGQAGAASNMGALDWTSLLVDNLSGSATSNPATPGVGSGGARITYTATVGGLNYVLVRNVSYVYPNDYFTDSYSLTIPAGNAATVKFYLGGDTAPGSSDLGYGIEILNPVRSTISLNPSSNIQFGLREVSGSKAFDGATSQRYSTPYATVDAGGDIGFVTTAANHDAGLMVQWNFGTAAGTFSASMEQFVNFQGARLTGSFSSSQVAAGSDVDLDLTMVNTNLSQATDLEFTLTLPSGLEVNTTNTQTANSCSGALTAADGASTITLAASTLASTANCLMTVPVTATTPGIYTLSSSSIAIPQASPLQNGLGTFSVEMTGPATAPTAFTDAVVGSIAAGTAFAGAIAANGYPAPTYAITAGALPTGLSFNTTTGEISGTATADGAYSFEVTATNSAGSFAQTFTGTVAAGPTPPAWVDDALAPIRTLAYSDGVSASGNPAPTYSISAGALPAGLTIDSTTGAITGTPTTTGAYDFTVRALNANGNVTKRFQGTVEAGLIYIPPPSTEAPSTTTPPTSDVPSTDAPEGDDDAPPAPVPVDDELPLQSAGQGQVFEGGVAVETVVEQVTGNQWRMYGTGFDLVADVPNVPVNPSGVLTLARFATVEVSGSGFKPFAFVNVWILPDGGLLPQSQLGIQAVAPIYLGKVQISADGTFDGDLPVASDVPTGQHTLQVNGPTPEDVIRSLNLGVEIQEGRPLELPVTGGSGRLAVIALWTLVLSALLLSVRRRLLNG